MFWLNDSRTLSNSPIRFEASLRKLRTLTVKLFQLLSAIGLRFLGFNPMDLRSSRHRFRHPRSYTSGANTHHHRRQACLASAGMALHPSHGAVQHDVLRRRTTVLYRRGYSATFNVGRSPMNANDTAIQTYLDTREVGPPLSVRTSFIQPVQRVIPIDKSLELPQD